MHVPISSCHHISENCHSSREKPIKSEFIPLENQDEHMTFRLEIIDILLSLFIFQINIALKMKFIVKFDSFIKPIKLRY